MGAGAEKTDALANVPVWVFAYDDVPASQAAAVPPGSDEQSPPVTVWIMVNATNGAFVTQIYGGES